VVVAPRAGWKGQDTKGEITGGKRIGKKRKTRRSPPKGPTARLRREPFKPSPTHEEKQCESPATKRQEKATRKRVSFEGNRGGR